MSNDRLPEVPVRPRARHLMDPANPRMDHPESESITRVQTWVMSVLAVTTILHLSISLAISAAFIDPAMRVERIGLLAIAGAFGVVAVAAGLAIHSRLVPTWWLLLGLVPGVVGAIVVLGVL